MTNELVKCMVKVNLFIIPSLSIKDAGGAERPGSPRGRRIEH